MFMCRKFVRTYSVLATIIRPTVYRELEYT